MGTQTPKIDPRSIADIVDQTETLAEFYSTWRRKSETDLDPGGALIRIFARMAGTVLDRLNQMPDKNFLAFLDLIGARLQPPQAARVPLTFLLAPGTATDAFVPERTIAATVPTDGSAEVLFETETALVVSPSRLIAAFSHDPAPGKDTYADVSDIVKGMADGSFPVFGGDFRFDQSIEHALYIADDALFTLPRPATFSIVIIWTAAPPIAQGVNAKTWPVWSMWDGTGWVPVMSERAVGIGGSVTPWNFTLSNLAIPEPVAVNGKMARWLRLTVPGSPASAQISRIILSGSSSKLIPERGFANGSPLDVSKDFLPFGERPRQGDALYLLSDALFSRTGATISVFLKLEDGAGSPSAAHPILSWEMWDGADWTTIPGTARSDSDSSKQGPENFNAEGTVSFSVPDWSSPVAVNGITGHWLRVRLAKGDYGSEPNFQPIIEEDKQATDSAGHGKYILKSGGFSAPRILSLRLGCDYTAPRPPVACLSGNDFRYRENIGSANFAPFEPSTEKDAAFYLAFDRPFSNRPVKLYLQVEPQPIAVQAPPEQGESPTTVTWEYAVAPETAVQDTPDWKRLTVEDGTKGLTAAGVMTFIGPLDMGFVSVLGRTAYWLRARRTGTASPRARRVLLNTVWASQSITTVNEMLGSSDGKPGQAFKTHGAPALAGQRIEVRETLGLSDDERSAIIAREGSDAITPVDAEAGLIQGNWVRWHEVPDFHASGPGDRHYVFDHMRGEVRFGDGRRGRIPPLGPGNIRAALYRTGGGDRGNCPAGSISQLKSPLASIAAVTHVEPADGGSDASSLDQVREHGPHILRHRGRCVAAQDYEDLALQASPKLARVLTITPQFNAIGEQWIDSAMKVTEAGKVTLVIVPRSREAKPVPSAELLAQVQSFVLTRCPPHIDLQVIAPDWIKVSVSATVAPISADMAEGLAQAVSVKLSAFLHPLTGGPDGKGWAFGREVHESDLYAMIEAIPGVDFVTELNIDASLDDPLPNVHFDNLPPGQQARVLVYSGMHSVNLAAVAET